MYKVDCKVGEQPRTRWTVVLQVGHTLGTGWLFIYTLRIHYTHTAVNLNSGYLKYMKVAHIHALFLYNCTPNTNPSADASVSVA